MKNSKLTKDERTLLKAYYEFWNASQGLTNKKAQATFLAVQKVMNANY